MGLTERHWFEDEEPELTERQLQDIVYENKKAYDNGYVKGFHDAKTKAEQLLKECPQIVQCKDCEHIYFASNCIQSEQTFACGKHGIDVTPDWFCADGERKNE